METGLEEITEDELIHRFITARLNDLHVALPAKVESYDSASQTVSVTLMVNKMLPDGAEPPNYVSEQLPKLADVPVVFQRCKQFTMTFPIAAGDYGLVIFNERSIAAWRATGNQSDPGDLGMHTLSSGVFIPGLFPDNSPASSADANNMIVGSDTDGNSRIEFKPTGGMNLGAGASKGVARNGDGCDGGTLVFFPGTGGATLSYIPPGGVVTPPTPPTINISLTPKINQGSSKIKAVD